MLGFARMQCGLAMIRRQTLSTYSLCLFKLNCRRINKFNLLQTHTKAESSAQPRGGLSQWRTGTYMSEDKVNIWLNLSLFNIHNILSHKKEQRDFEITCMLAPKS